MNDRMTDHWPPRVIVAGVDGSDQSTRAARLAAAMAVSHGAALHLVTVVRPPEGWWGIVGSPPPADALSRALSDAQRQILDRVAKQVADLGVEAELSEEIGEPATTLVAYCADNAADLLVVGKKGAGLLERLVLGSVADRVAHDAPCPVVIVP